MPLAIPTGDDPGKGSVAMGIGKRSLPAFLPHPGTVLTSPQAYKAVQSLRAFPRSSGALQRFLSHGKDPKGAGGTRAGKFRSSWPRVTTEASTDIQDMQLLDPSPFHPRSQPGLDGCTGRAGDGHEQELPTQRLLCFPHCLSHSFGITGHFSFHET